jgi:hypothetical protein
MALTIPCPLLMLATMTLNIHNKEILFIVNEGCLTKKRNFCKLNKKMSL